MLYRLNNFYTMNIYFEIVISVKIILVKNSVLLVKKK